MLSRIYSRLSIIRSALYRVLEFSVNAEVAKLDYLKYKQLSKYVHLYQMLIYQEK